MIPREEIPGAVSSSLHLLNMALYQAQLADFECEITERPHRPVQGKQPRQFLLLNIKVCETQSALEALA